MQNGLDSSYLRERLIKVLNFYGMTLQHVCDCLGWKYHHVNKYKNGHNDMSLERKRELSQFLDKYDNETVKVG